jgi:aminomethyltransferase
MSENKKTPLYHEHIKLGAKMVPFAGYEMPVQYVGLKEEHINVRTNVGLFDVSHMGEVRIKGPKALETVEWLTTNDVKKLQKGDAQYSLLPNAEGGLVDDIIVYCVEPGIEYFICVNAANKDKDVAWMLSHNQGATITDESDQWGQIAVQGPKAPALLDKVLNHPISAMAPFKWVPIVWKGQTLMVATTGYTGEKGAEIFVPASATVDLWQALLEGGQEMGVAAIGLGARDTLRLEMRYSLYGHEIDDAINPYAAGLGWVIKPSAKNFLGKERILAQKEAGLPLTLVGFKLTEKGIPRQGYSLFSFDNQEMGKVTSGTLSPSTNEAIGLGYVWPQYAKVGSEILVDIRGRKAKAVVVQTPFVKPS